MSDVLRQRFDPESGGPTDLEGVTRALSENRRRRRLEQRERLVWGLLFLLRNRRYGLWWSGQATVNVLDALVTLIGAPSDAPSTDTLDVIVNGRKAGP